MDSYEQRMRALDAQAAAALAAAATAAPLPPAAGAAGAKAGAGMPPTDSARSLDGESEYASATSADSRRASLDAAALNADFERHVVVM